MNWQEVYNSKVASLDEAAKIIKSGDRVFFPSGASTPIALIQAICNRKDELKHVTMMGSLVFAPLDCFKREYKGHIHYNSVFMGPAERAFYEQGNIDYTSFQFSDILWIQKNITKPNVMICEVSPPDENGNMSYGPHGTFSNHTCRMNAKTVIVQVNKQTPYVYGTEDAFINVRDVACICEVDHPLIELKNAVPTDTERVIGAHIVSYIEDGSTVQIGVGGLGNAVGYSLEHHKDLGVHTEMLVDSMLHLAEKGVITGARKTLNRGEMSVSFAIGSADLYRYMDRNKNLKAYHINYIANPNVIGQNDNFISINNALSVDLTGQVCAESIGHRQFSGTGGQVDFVRGAKLSKGGKSFIAVESTYTKKDGSVHSRIQSALAPGSIITTLRTDVHYIVTEFGVADLKCQSAQKRVRAMINIAHPMFREQLEREAYEARLLVD